MFSIEDIIYLVICATTIIVSISLVVNWLDRRHKQDLEAEKRSRTEEYEFGLNKAQIYSNKDISVARMEQAAYNQVDSFQTGTEIDAYLPLIQGILSNPEALEKVKGLINGIGK